MHPDTELLILGGGCAGLSLGMQLSSLNERCPQTLILESRSNYKHDRNWCFWKDEATASHTLVQHSWEQMHLRHKAETVTVPCGLTPYQMLPSHHFYSAAQKAIQASPRVDLQLGISITDIPQKIDGMWHIKTTGGKVCAARVIDTRPPSHNSKGDAILWQSFSGIEVETSVDCFNPAQVELMDFSQENPSYVAFTYVLPTTLATQMAQTILFYIVNTEYYRWVHVMLRNRVIQAIRMLDFTQEARGLATAMHFSVLSAGLRNAPHN